ncbi:MAG: argininosuccinate lyase [Chitinivibrionales bacterium]|nr:argininosuccinate lyase [Chitinivibrionales bacterium]
MMWGSRFQQQPASESLRFSSSLSVDCDLIAYDVACSKAHSRMLGQTGLCSKEEARMIEAGLDELIAEFDQGVWQPDPAVHEDVHSAVEARLIEKIGTVAAKLHTGRSRNDLVAADLRLWTKEKSQVCREAIVLLQRQLVDLARHHVSTVMPSYTHLQRAQPVSLAFHLLAYVEMLQRSKQRFSFARTQSDASPLGSGAAAGSTLPIDRNCVAAILGFDRLCTNSLDAVSDREFVLDFIHACVVCMMQLSRFAEELVLWSSAEWHFIRMSDRFTTGSSLMPQKRNPDIAELIRGRCGRVYGHYIAIATMLKGLPLSYNRDLQEDKHAALDAFATMYDCCTILTALLQEVTVNTNRFTKELTGDFCFATDMAEWLVTRQVPFRQAHAIVGAVVLYAERSDKKLSELTLEELVSIDERFDQTVFSVLSVDTCLERRVSYGSPNPRQITNQILRWQTVLGRSGDPVTA